jgi:hypothetical protein
MRSSLIRAIVVKLIAVACLGLAFGAEASAEEPDPPYELRNFRYCEIIPFTVGPGAITAHVYNTLGWNDCPADQWDSLSEQQVNLEFHSFASTMNGPRYWVIDHLEGFGDTAAGETFTFGDIKMSLRGQLDTPIGEPLVGEQYYVPNQVQRETRYTFHRDEPTFQLIDPDGNVYVMQSYAQITDPTLHYGELKGLASQLDLPTGWKYRSRTYDYPTTVTANGLAFVVNDDLAGAYQRMTAPTAKFAKVTRDCASQKFQIKVSVTGDTARSKVKFGKKVILKRTISRNFTVRIPTRATRPGFRQVWVTAINDAGKSSIQARLPICRN